jgi:hypothetical protein
MGDILQNISFQMDHFQGKKKKKNIYIYIYIFNQNYWDEILGCGWLIFVYKWDVTCIINQFTLKGNWGVYRCRSVRRKVVHRKDLNICCKLYINKIQQDATVCRYLFTAKLVSTCFGCPSHPSSGVHKL